MVRNWGQGSPVGIAPTMPPL